jgi:hypothetical protein
MFKSNTRAAIEGLILTAIVLALCLRWGALMADGIQFALIGGFILGFGGAQLFLHRNLKY